MRGGRGVAVGWNEKITAGAATGRALKFIPPIRSPRHIIRFALSVDVGCVCLYAEIQRAMLAFQHTFHRAKWGTC
jgi:hypothetical protein